ncbi:MAG TPA: enoyl-CoA hydratase-related protein [Acidimicrobiia bacterium]|nr:enoyl-CoA hydratase-related protein [Acidimicrobiia bacterium]
MTTADPDAGRVRIARVDGVLRLTLDRPAKRNALTDEMVAALVAALEDAATADDVRVVVLDGAGEHFCGGADIVARNRAGANDTRPRPGSIQRRLPTGAHRLVSLICETQVPVVCAVRGWAAGIGFQLALAADFTVATHDARFWEPFAARGFTPDSGATWLLPRRVGDVRARELLVLGREIDGRTAAEWGAIHAAVASEDHAAAVDALVAQLASGPTVALGLTKWLLHAGAGRGLDAQLVDEAFALELSSRTQDFREGLAAFTERRTPRFEGR